VIQFLLNELCLVFVYGFVFYFWILIVYIDNLSKFEL